MNVLFCNAAWMKHYIGVTDEDKPKNGGAYVKENEYGCECYNFLDYNGKCYGFVMLRGNMNLELHFEGAKKHQDFLKNVLVIWVATNDTNETRIVGWYKNATIYREEQFAEAFTNENFNTYYRMEALSKDCYLLPEDQRTFPIQRASRAGKGTGMGQSNVWYADSAFAKTILIPKVIEYIDNYNGEFDNTAWTEDDLNEIIEDSDKELSFKQLYNAGIKDYKDEYWLDALINFNTARKIKETKEVLLGIANSLFSLDCFDKAIEVFKKVLELENNNIEVMENLISCYDFSYKKEETIEYCNKIIDILDDSEDGINEKVYYCCVMFDIYISLMDEKNAIAVTEKVLKCSNDKKVKKLVDGMLDTIKQTFEK